MRRDSFRDRALVVKTYDFGEADRIIVLLTRDHGIVRGVAKGVRRSKSRFGSRLQLFVELDVQLYPGRKLSTISGADTVGYYASGIIEDFTRYSCASAILEIATHIAGLENDPHLFEETTRALKNIQDSPEPILNLDEFMLRAMNHAGWAPSLFDCAACGRPGPHNAFHPGVGGAVCLYCRPPGSAEVPPEALHMMWLVANGQAARIPREHPEQQTTIHQLTTAHLQWHIERKLPTLAVLDQA
ncbi:DNA repair protein RecO [Corynebacterium glutamicum MB001]|uniref:DNA repair protein RecO n=2 Tax=Corynebacterium TaxID=1716 RepID=Q8NNC0_CORGL|nr:MULTISPECIES: DNA repair protein RecO [Corynebacterium]AGT06014.1 DNA repair protein RecO [Corynebacterium glutamicum MB001]AIK85713.1 DNA recombination protein RecO [Corynebacterium glutamicum]AIK88498.1 DNA recombination protein RecO [Corynebacterium glutamicum]AJE67953.1 DNA recombination protein RecO [Corynebacterium glutamicum]AKF28048.1 DNA recombination protein RecO [[Brevibacterium] flavum]